MNDQLVETWITEGRVVSVCPEVEAGMNIPRMGNPPEKQR